jgi:hypothetical protein
MKNEIKDLLKKTSTLADYISACTGQPAYLLDALVRFDVVGIFADLLRSGWYIPPETGKMTPGQQGLRWDVPWVYVHPDPRRLCDLYTEIFNRCMFVPTPCLNCWKVVVKPRTVRELMDLLIVMSVYSSSDEYPNRWCKCGIEKRSYVPQNYGGYFYCDSKASGLSRYDEVRELVSRQISPDVPVILKRYCTEFELKLGPTDTYKRPEIASAIEHEIFECIDRQKPNVPQSPMIIRHVIREWAEFAWERGDPTAASTFNGGQPYYSNVVTYHEGDKK